MPSLITPMTSSRFYGAYINDDWKVSKNLTLNLGLRYEYEQPYSEEQNRLTAPLDLTKPIPELQGVQMPAAVKQFYTGSWSLNGAFQFTSNDKPGAWNADSGTWSPRVGMAYRLNDTTSMRAGYGRYTHSVEHVFRRFGSIQRSLYRILQLYGRRPRSRVCLRCSCRIRSHPPFRWFLLTGKRTEPIQGLGVV